MMVVQFLTKKRKANNDVILRSGDPKVPLTPKRDYYYYYYY